MTISRRKLLTGAAAVVMLPITKVIPLPLDFVPYPVTPVGGTIVMSDTNILVDRGTIKMTMKEYSIDNIRDFFLGDVYGEDDE